MDKRLQGMIATGVGGVLLLVSAVTKLWWTASMGKMSIGIGPLGMEMCERGRCVSRTLDSSKTVGWAIGAWGFFCLGLAAALWLIGTAVTTGMKKRITGKYNPAKNAMGTSAGALLFALIFFFAHPSWGGGGIGMSVGFPFALIGILGGGFGAYTIYKLETQNPV